MQEKVQKNYYSPQRLIEIRKRLPKKYGAIISEMLNNRYQPETICNMVRGYRTMQPVVYEAAIKLIGTLDDLKSGKL